jgi:glutaredoxin
VLGLSVDSVPSLKAWADSLGGITYPLLSDFYPHGQIAELYGVLRPDGRAERSIFVIDKQGLIRYIDVHDIGTQPDNEILFEVLYEMEPEAAAILKQIGASEPAPAEPEDNLVLYCTPWCPDCKRARLYLNENNIPYVEIDISKDREAAKRVRAWTGGFETTPTFTVQGTIIINFDRPRLEQVLGIKK